MLSDASRRTKFDFDRHRDKLAVFRLTRVGFHRERFVAKAFYLINVVAQMDAETEVRFP